MANGKEPIIVIKRKKGGHAAHHGGAWKVAYADFVTAMMAFFLVMWLLGADEETKSSISHYFNNPASALRPDLLTKEAVPIGDRTGSGDNVIKGEDGAVPDDLVERPNRPYQMADTLEKEPAAILDSLLSNESMLSLEMLKFSIPEEYLFKKGSADEWNPKAEEVMKKLGILALKYKGKMTVMGTYSKASESDSRRPANEASNAGTYEFQLSRASHVAAYAVKKQWATEDQISTQVREVPRSSEAEDAEDGNGSSRRIEFTLTKNHVD